METQETFIFVLLIGLVIIKCYVSEFIISTKNGFVFEGFEAFKRFETFRGGSGGSGGRGGRMGISGGINRMNSSRFVGNVGNARNFASASARNSANAYAQNLANVATTNYGDNGDDSGDLIGNVNYSADSNYSDYQAYLLAQNQQSQKAETEAESENIILPNIARIRERIQTQ